MPHLYTCPHGSFVKLIFHESLILVKGENLVPQNNLIYGMSYICYRDKAQLCCATVVRPYAGLIIIAG